MMENFKEGQKVCWRDPAKKASDVYRILSGSETQNRDKTEKENLIYLIGNAYDKKEVAAAELYPLSSKVVFRKREETGTVVALFPEQRLEEEEPAIVVSFDLAGKQGEADYDRVMKETFPAGMADCLELLPKLKNAGYETLEIVPDNMDSEQLLSVRGIIAAGLISNGFITDFSVHDVRFIQETNAGVPFIWLVRESGTYLYRTDKTDEIQNLTAIMNHYDNCSNQNYCLYRYNGSGLYPVFPKTIRQWVENELKTIKE